MKYFATLIVVIGIIAIFLFLLMRKNEIKTVTKKWDNLIHSKNKNQELKAVKNLNTWIFKSMEAFRYMPLIIEVKRRT